MMYHSYRAHKISSAAEPTWGVSVDSSDFQAEKQILVRCPEDPSLGMRARVIDRSTACFSQLRFFQSQFPCLLAL